MNFGGMNYRHLCKKQSTKNSEKAIGSEKRQDRGESARKLNLSAISNFRIREEKKVVAGQQTKETRAIHIMRSYHGHDGREEPAIFRNIQLYCTQVTDGKNCQIFSST